ncbi:glycosyltransferase 61 family protein [Agrobacterium pusense]|uniref:glycosyltransferase 61 family protein n=1 Tax=Agrobacterium pusense TaxID=648995 RepID=UPI000D1B98B9|nr:glycosyltransferase 61 family protein [Agrobacterium pusense]
MGTIDHLANAVVAPYWFADGAFRGGLADEAASQNARMPTGRLFRDEPQTNVIPTKAMLGRHLFAGPIWNHFGHILVDSLHRLWGYNGHDSIVFTGVIGLRGVSCIEDLHSWTIPSFVPQLLNYMGINARIHIVSEPTRFERLDVPELGAIWRMNIKPFYREHLRRFQSKIEARTKSIKPTAKRLYYSRTHMLTDGGIIGSSYFEKILQENGFTVCQPEKLSLEQQFANLMNSDQIVFDEGSSVHLTELLDYVPAKLYMIPRRDNDVVFGRALTPRGGLVYLSPENNLGSLPDRNGSISSPATLSYVKAPEKVVNVMQEYGLVASTFNMEEYRQLEFSDLMSAKSKDTKLRDLRANLLADFRSKQ